MKTLAFIGNKERGNEIIAILKSMGGVDQPIPCDGSRTCAAYYIRNGYIVYSFIREKDIIYMTIEDWDVICGIVKSIMNGNNMRARNKNTRPRKNNLPRRKLK